MCVFVSVCVCLCVCVSALLTAWHAEAGMSFSQSTHETVYCFMRMAQCKDVNMCVSGWLHPSCSNSVMFIFPLMNVLPLPHTVKINGCTLLYVRTKHMCFWMSESLCVRGHEQHTYSCLVFTKYTGLRSGNVNSIKGLVVWHEGFSWFCSIFMSVWANPTYCIT